MRLVGLGLLVHRAVTHVLHAQRAGNHQHLIEGTSGLGFQNHAAHARVQRQLGQCVAHRGEFVVVIHRAQLGQQLVAVRHGATLRRFNEGKVFDRPQVQRLHAQNHGGQRTAQYFGVGKALAAREVLRVIQPDANTVGHPAATPGTLVGCRLADGLDHQLLNLAPEAVAFDTRRACVNHVPNPRYGERRFSHIGRQHNAAVVVVGKNLVLFGRAQACKQRQHIRAPVQRLMRQMLAQVVSGLPDFALTRQEHQNVAGAVWAEPQLVDRVGNRIVQVVVT